MTTGERLVDISTLTSDTALQHFLNISVGGATDVIYTCLPVVVSVQEAELTVVRVQETDETLKVITTFMPQPIVKVEPVEILTVNIDEEEKIIVK